MRSSVAEDRTTLIRPFHSKMRTPDASMKRASGFGLVDVAIILAILGLLFVIAPALMMRDMIRSKQAEAKANLKAMLTAETAFHAEKERFSTLVDEIGFYPERNNRYAYFAGPGPSLQVRSGAVAQQRQTDTGIEIDSFKFNDRTTVELMQINSAPTISPCGNVPVVGLGGPGGTQGWTGAARGQIDADPTLDFWSIASFDRIGRGASCNDTGPNPAGEPMNETNDVWR
jgi:type IV pilus assembly protein PilA